MIELIIHNFVECSVQFNSREDKGGKKLTTQQQAAEYHSKCGYYLVASYGELTQRDKIPEGGNNVPNQS